MAPSESKVAIRAASSHLGIYLPKANVYSVTDSFVVGLVLLNGAESVLDATLCRS